jgi:hypothetical protein
MCDVSLAHGHSPRMAMDMPGTFFQASALHEEAGAGAVLNHLGTSVVRVWTEKTYSRCGIV